MQVVGAAAECLAGLVAAVLVPDHAAHCAAAGDQQHQGEPAEARASHQEPGVSRGQEYNKISSP